MSIPPEQAFEAFRAHCLAKEGATEEYPWGDVAWKIGGKMFACGGKDSNSLTVKSTTERQAALTQHPSIEKAAYVGRFGWITIRAEDQDTLDIALDLIDDSYEMIRPRKARTL